MIPIDAKKGCLICEDTMVKGDAFFQPGFSWVKDEFKLERGETICSRCVDKLEFLDISKLIKCRADNLLYLAPYGGYIKDLIHEFKFGHNTSLAIPLGRLLALRVFLEEEKKAHQQGIKGLLGYMANDLLKLVNLITGTSAEHDLVTFIPLHANRLMERGFNQAELLAERAAESLGLDLHELLVRNEDTPPQGQLERKKRLENLEGKFDLKAGIRPETYSGKNILLVDDISTTGASIKEGTRVLLEKGAKDVKALVLCR